MSTSVSQPDLHEVKDYLEKTLPDLITRWQVEELVKVLTKVREDLTKLESSQLSQTQIVENVCEEDNNYPYPGIRYKCTDCRYSVHKVYVFIRDEVMTNTIAYCKECLYKRLGINKLSD